MSRKNIHKLDPPGEKSRAVIGISSHENDYRLSWAFNETLGFQLKRSDDLLIQDIKRNEEHGFSVYAYISDQGTEYRLISNRCENGFLLQELKNIDFIFVIQSEESSPDLMGMLTKVRQIPFVSAAFPLNPDQIKGKKRIWI